MVFWKNAYFVGEISFENGRPIILAVKTINTTISAPSGIALGVLLLSCARKNRAHKQSCWI